MSQYNDFIAANTGYSDERILPVEETEEPGFAEGEPVEWSRINEALAPSPAEFDATPIEVRRD